MTSPCYKCPLHDQLEGTACKLYCGCFKVYEKKSDEIKAKRYQERKAVMDANCVRTDGIRIITSMRNRQNATVREPVVTCRAIFIARSINISRGKNEDRNWQIQTQFR